MNPRYSITSEKMYKATRKLESFSVNEMRKYDIQRFLRIKNMPINPNIIGSFFGYLSREGFIERVGQTRAKHIEAKNRWVWTWKWTKKAKRYYRRRLH